MASFPRHAAGHARPPRATLLALFAPSAARNSRLAIGAMQPSAYLSRSSGGASARAAQWASARPILLAAVAQVAQRAAQLLVLPGELDLARLVALALGRLVQAFLGSRRFAASRRPRMMSRPSTHLGDVLVVRAAEQPEVLDGRPPAMRDGHDVVHFELAAFFAAVAIRADERALAAVALPDRVADGVRNVAWVGGTSPGVALAPAPAGCAARARGLSVAPQRRLRSCAYCSAIARSSTSMSAPLGMA